MNPVTAFIKNALISNEKRLVLFLYKALLGYIRFADWCFLRIVESLEKKADKVRPEDRNAIYKEVESIKFELKENERWKEQIDREMQEFLQ